MVYYIDMTNTTKRRKALPFIVWQCQHCGRTFTTIARLGQHEQKDHR